MYIKKDLLQSLLSIKFDVRFYFIKLNSDKILVQLKFIFTSISSFKHPNSCYVYDNLCFSLTYIPIAHHLAPQFKPN